MGLLRDEGGAASRTKQEMVDAAARLFAENGYERTTVRGLAVAVRRRSGTLFHHFGTKEEILLAVVESGAQLAHDKLDAALETTHTPRSRVANSIRGHLDALRDPRVAMAVTTLREGRSLSPDARARLVRLRDAYERRFDEVLSDAAAAGVLPIAPAADQVRAFRLFLLGALNSVLGWYHDEGNFNLDDVAQRFFAYICRDNGPDEAEPLLRD